MRWHQLRRLLVVVLVLAAGLLSPAARADAPVQLYRSIAGYVNFTGTEATMRTGRTVCEIYSSTTVLSKTLSSIPSGANVLSAQLYWAGSSTTPDNQVTFNGNAVTAQRSYTAAYITGGVTYNYFSAAADVTSIVKAKGNGTYTFTNLTVSNGSPWCSVEGVLGGFALLVVYEDPATQPFRVLNIYEGFQYTRNSSLTLNLSNFRVPNPLGSATGRIGHITWEGDDSLQAQGEDLSLNGTIMTDAINPTGNQFNSKSNIDGDTKSYGIDFDAYTISSPVIQPDQTTASTVYSSGQDLVLLSAEIVAVPNVPTVDLALTMSRSGQTIPGQRVSYTLQLQNNGPNDELGPITIVDSLPFGMTFVSYSGTGWTCTASGSDITCTRTGTLAAKSTAPAITLLVDVSASATGTYVNTATVSGTIFDNVSANNTATDTASDPTVLNAGMVLTDRPCTDGTPISTNLSDSGCHRIISLVANTPTAMYITNLDANGIPNAPKWSGNTNYSPLISLTCINPGTAGPPTSTTASYAGASLDPCVANGVTPGTGATNTWTHVNLVFPGGQPSALLKSTYGATKFQYPDVGLLQLNFTDLNSKVISSRFISQPAQLTLAIKRKSDNLPNPGPTNGFVKAGEPFTVTIAAQMDGGGAPPNFGKETSPAISLTLGQSGGPDVIGSFAYQGNATFSGDFVYKEVGDITLQALLGSALHDYLGSGVPVPGQSQLVGRFYPAFFLTTTTANFPCITRMNCPVGTLPHGESLVVSGGAYSNQPFKVVVTAHATDGTPLTGYYGSYAKAITLKAVAQPGSSTAAPNGTLVTSTDTTPVLIPALAGPGELTVSPKFKLAVPFVGTAPRASWTKPTAVYINATAPQTRATSGGGSIADDITSNRGTAAISVEGGVLVLNGRLQVENAHGSELIRLPMQIGAQYWTGTAWEYNAGDSASKVGPAAAFTKCTLNLVCSPSLLRTSSDVILKDGLGKIMLNAPGAGHAGSAMVQMTSVPPYLPSALGQAVFGVYKSRLIYIREVY